MLQVGYLGPAGSFSEHAMQRFFKNIDIEAMQFHLYPSLQQLLTATLERTINLAVFPIRNSTSGLLTNDYDETFLQQITQSEKNITILAELFLPLDFYLLSNADINQDVIRYVHSNAYAQQQCAYYFEQHPQWEVIVHASSSRAAEFVKDLNDPQHASLASAQAAKIYDLIILEEVFFAPKHNPIMQFWLLGNVKSEIINTENSVMITNCIFQHINRSELLFLLQKNRILVRDLYNIDDHYLIAELFGAIDINHLAIEIKNHLSKILGVYSSYK